CDEPRRGEPRGAVQPAGAPDAAIDRRAAKRRRAAKEPAMTDVLARVTGPLGGVRDRAGRNAQRVVNALRLAGGLDRPQLGCSPHTVTWRRDKVTVRHYTDATAGRPVLLVPSLINRSHIWDLRPGDSFVEGLQSHGYDVFLVDWVVPDERDAHNSLATYVDDYLPASFSAVSE